MAFQNGTRIKDAYLAMIADQNAKKKQTVDFAAGQFVGSM